MMLVSAGSEFFDFVRASRSLEDLAIIFRPTISQLEYGILPGLQYLSSSGSEYIHKVETIAVTRVY